MKRLISIFSLLVLLNACKKEQIPDAEELSLLGNIKLQLMDSVVPADFQTLDFSKAVLSKFDEEDYTILRIPFFNQPAEKNFMALKLGKNGLIRSGRIINLSLKYQAPATKGVLRANGEIIIYTLRKETLVKSPIINGYIKAFHSGTSATASFRESVVEIPLMPEVVVIASYPPNGSWSYSNWYNIARLVSQFESGNSGGAYYSNSEPYYGGGGGGAPYPDAPILIDYEPVEDLSAIDLKKYLKCFENIPDAGADCTIKILTDLPVDTDPQAFFNWDNGSPGHTFLQITKKNGNDIVQQNIGFYPVQGWKITLTPAPSDGKFVDNFDHEFNASLAMSLTPEQLRSTLIHMEYLSNFIKYDIDDYNCTDFSLEVFNYKRTGDKLAIPMYDIPGGSAINGTATPQGLYQQLVTMKAGGTPESGNIIIPGVKGFVSNSSGPCM